LKEKELGNQAYKKKDFEGALKHYNKAVELDGGDITYLNNIAGKCSSVAESWTYDKPI
jgi:stress-induced-phosphoprotein 1